MSTYARKFLLESCLLCDRLAPDRFPLIRSADRFGNERAPQQRRMAPVCERCLSKLERAGAKGLVETESGSRWTLATVAGAPAVPATGAAPPA
ncbi:MAG: hypothetical protein U0531_12815 [Dehalococcoidia bacterium]